MPPLLPPDMELFVASGHVYLPLLYDPDIADESAEAVVSSRSCGPSSDSDPHLIEVNGRVFIRTLNLESLVESYDGIDPAGYAELQRVILKGLQAAPTSVDVSPDGKLGTIIQRVMPHFVRSNRGFERGALSRESFLDLLCTRIDIPGRFMEAAAGALDTGVWLRRLKALEAMEEAPEALPEGSTTGEVLQRWLLRALRRLILHREKLRLERELREREQWGEARTKHLALMLYLAQLTEFELDGFGFSRIGSRDDYYIYKRTGEYFLKDYYGRSYRFPDCRVAVSTLGPLRPIVLERYKHPFLLHHRPKQEICLSGYEQPGEASAENIIRVLEDGINALLYGYDARRRNGYHSLDKTLYYVKTIEFDDYRV